MHLKFLKHGKGSGSAAIEYLLREKDSKGVVRADIKVLRGNPEQLAQLIDSLKTVCRYSSAVLAWHKDDDPTPEEMETALKDFEHTAFPGLQSNQFSWIAVEHVEDDGSKHIHIIVARAELTTGLSMNIAPPGSQARYDHMRDALNYEHGWARPDDPRLARPVQPGAVASFAGWKAGTDPRQQITDWLLAQVEAGTVNNRQDVIRELSTLGQINREGRDYISIRAEEGAKPIRLKGPIYDENFDGWAFRSSPAAAKKRPAGREQPDPRAAAAARESLAAAIARCAVYNRRRYKRNAKQDFGAGAAANDVAAIGQPLPVVADRGRGERLGLVEDRPGGRPGAETRPNPDRSPSGAGDKGVSDDGIREIVIRAIEQAQRSARAALQAIERCTASTRSAYRSVVSSLEAAGTAYRSVVEALARAARAAEPIPVAREADGSVTPFLSNAQLYSMDLEVATAPEPHDTAPAAPAASPEARARASLLARLEPPSASALEAATARQPERGGGGPKPGR
jgi:hypothetical protein